MRSRAPAPVRSLPGSSGPTPQLTWPLATLALVAASLATLSGALPPAARGELAPWVYGEQQRRAALVVELRVLEVAPLPAAEAGLRLRGRVLAVKRQAPGGGVRANQVLTLQLSAPPSASRPPMVGPSPLRPPAVGSRVTAWLQPSANRAALWLPAAGGRSFGPSLEASTDPNTPVATPAGAAR